MWGEMSKFLPISFHDTVLLSHAYKRTKKSYLGVDIPWIQIHRRGKKGKPMKVAVAGAEQMC